MEKPFSLITRIIPAQLILYLTLFFSTNNKIFFLAIIIFALYLFWLLEDFKKALWLTLVAVIPFNWGLRNWDLQIPLPFDFFTPNKEVTFLHFSLAPKLIISFFLMIILLPKMKRENLNFKSYDFFLILFFLFGIFSLFFSNNIALSFFGFFAICQALVFYFLAKYFFKKKEDLKLGIVILLILAFFEGFLATSQFLIKKPFGKMIEESVLVNPYGRTTVEDIFLFRSSGTFTDPNTMAIFWLMIISLVLSQMIYKYPLIKNRLIVSIVFIFSLLGLFSTFSRAAWFVFFFVALFLILFFLKKKEFSLKYKYLFILMGIVFLFALPLLIQRFFGFQYSLMGEKGSGLTRIDLMKESWLIIKNNPLLGIGPGNFLSQVAINNTTGVASRFFYPVHNLYLFLGAELGLPALLSFLLFLFFFFKKNLLAKKEKELEGLRIGLLGGIFAYLFSVVFYTGYGFNFEFAFLFLGILAIL